jgi:hypothetical protein
MSPENAVFLLASLAGLLLGALLVRGVLLGYPPRLLARSVFGRKEQAIIAACADAFFPPGGPIPISGTEAGLVAYMDAYVGRMAPNQRALVRLLFWFIEHGPWIFGPKLARFTRLDLADRIAVLDSMAQSRIYFRRIAFLSMRTMLTLGYLANPEVAGRMRMIPNLAPFEREAPTPRRPAGEEAFA